MYEKPASDKSFKKIQKALISLLRTHSLVYLYLPFSHIENQQHLSLCTPNNQQHLSLCTRNIEPRYTNENHDWSEKGESTEPLNSPP